MFCVINAKRESGDMFPANTQVLRSNSGKTILTTGMLKSELFFLIFESQ